MERRERGGEGGEGERREIYKRDRGEGEREGERHLDMVMKSRK